MSSTSLSAFIPKKVFDTLRIWRIGSFTATSLPPSLSRPFSRGHERHTRRLQPNAIGRATTPCVMPPCRTLRSPIRERRNESARSLSFVGSERVRAASLKFGPQRLVERAEPRQSLGIGPHQRGVGLDDAFDRRRCADFADRFARHRETREARRAESGALLPCARERDRPAERGG